MHDSLACPEDLTALGYYLSARLDRPRRIERFAQDVFACITANSNLLRHGTLDELRDVAAHVLRCRDRHADATRQDMREAVSCDKLQAHIDRTLSQLPEIHASVLRSLELRRLSARQASYHARIQVAVVGLYHSQALAMLRAADWEPTSTDPWADNSAPQLLLMAQRAAHWCLQLRCREPASQEFMAWLCHRIAHVREFLLAIAWRDSLDALTVRKARR